VQGERNGKGESEVFSFPLPNRSLPYLKVVQGERNGKGRSEVFSFPFPNRSLTYLKVVREGHKKRETLKNTSLRRFIVPVLEKKKIRYLSKWENL